MLDKKKLYYLFYLPILVFYVFISFHFINTSIQAIQYPFALENGEGFVLYTSMQYQKGLLPYGEIKSPHDLVNNYPPVFNLLSNAIDPLFRFPFASGRFISFLSILGIAIFLFLSILLITRSVLWSTVSGLSFITIPFIFSVVRYRVDPLSVFFSVAGLYFFLIALKKDSRWWINILFLVLGIYTKHSSVCAPMAILLFLFFTNHKRKWFFSIRFFACCLIPGLILQLATGGYFLKHLISYTTTGFSFSGISVLHRLLPLLFFSLMSLFFIVTFFKDKKTDPIKRFLSIYFVLNILLLGLIFKEGSSILYLIEFTASVILIGSAGTFILVKKLRIHHTDQLLFAIPIILFLSIALPWFDKSSNSIQINTLLHYKELLSNIYSEDMEIFERIKNTQGRILSEDISYLLLCGKNPEWNPFMTAQLHKSGTVSDELIRKEIRQKRFSSVFLSFYLNPVNGKVTMSGEHTERFTRGVFQDILKNYKIIPNKSYTKTTRFGKPKTFLYPR